MPTGHLSAQTNVVGGGYCTGSLKRRHIQHENRPLCRSLLWRRKKQIGLSEPSAGRHVDAQRTISPHTCGEGTLTARFDTRCLHLSRQYQRFASVAALCCFPKRRRRKRFSDLATQRQALGPERYSLTGRIPANRHADLRRKRIERQRSPRGLCREVRFAGEAHQRADLYGSATPHFAQHDPTYGAF